MGGGGFLTQLAASGQTVPLVVAREECAVLRNWEPQGLSSLTERATACGGVQGTPCLDSLNAF